MRAKRRSKSAVYIYALRFAGRILRLGRLVRPFFWIESRCSRDCVFGFQISRRFFFSTVLFGWQTSPSIFTLRDFVAAIAGPFLRRGFRPPPTTVAYLSTNIPLHLYSLRYRRSILTAVMLGSVLHCYRVAGNGPHNNRRLALWSRYNSAMGIICQYIG